MAATSLELFFIDGKPDGLLTAEVFGWTGHLLVVPRTRLADALKRDESSYTGVYILIGELDGEALAYIGEGENIAKRIRDHDAKKDWWTKAVLITSAANNLHKAHVQYLEARLVQIGNEANMSKLDNNTIPSLPSLSESAAANMESFLAQILMILPAVRIDLFTTKTKPVNPLQSVDGETDYVGPVFELALKKEGVKATAVLEGGDFVVLKGSLARKVHIGDSENSSYGVLYEKLVAQGVLLDQGDQKIFTQSYAFSSTSAAAAVCKGRNTSGPVAWKVQGSGVTYKEWESSLLSED